MDDDPGSMPTGQSCRAPKDNAVLTRYEARQGFADPPPALIGGHNTHSTILPGSILCSSILGEMGGERRGERGGGSPGGGCPLSSSHLHLHLHYSILLRQTTRTDTSNNSTPPLHSTPLSHSTSSSLVTAVRRLLFQQCLSSPSSPSRLHFPCILLCPERTTRASVSATRIVIYALAGSPGVPTEIPTPINSHHPQPSPATPSRLPRQRSRDHE